MQGKDSKKEKKENNELNKEFVTENSLQYFPMADPWTWTAVDKFLLATTAPVPVSAPAPASARAPSTTQGGLSKVQLRKRPQRPQHPRTQTDTYRPDYHPFRPHGHNRMG